MMTGKRVLTACAALALAVVAAMPSAAQLLPPPQIASAAGKTAPDFTLPDQNGKPFHLSAQRGNTVLLVFYRGYWWAYCTGQLREFAEHEAEFDAVGVRLVGISVDDVKQTHELWEKLQRKFPLLSDVGGQVTRRYGVLHPGGAGTDIALDTSLLVDEHGVERWRHVSRTLPDLLSAADTVAHIRESLPHGSKSPNRIP